MPYHVFGNGGFGNLNAQLEQLAVNAWRTPARVVAAHHPDQISNLLWHAGPTWLAAADFPPPEQAKAFTIPGDHGFGLDDQQGGFPVAPRASQPDPEDSVGWCQPQVFWSRPTQDGELLPQGEVSSRSWAEVLSIEVRAPSTVNRRCCADPPSK
jgi:hypothetical protein